MAENKNSRAVVPSALPNLFLSTTYTLNKSLSKRVTIGLEHQGSYFVPVIKLSGSSSYQVTLDVPSWELFLQNVDMITCYFKDPLAFNQTYGSPSKIYLPSHDIEFTTSYGGKSVVLINRPIVTQTSVIALTQDKEDEENEPASKKRKINHPPSVVMQSSTFDGLKELQECITAKLHQLTNIAGLVNRGFGLIYDNVDKILREENDENTDVKKLLSDYVAFKKFYNINRDDILVKVEMNLSMAGHDIELFFQFTNEVFAFGLSTLASELNKNNYQLSTESHKL